MEWREENEVTPSALASPHFAHYSDVRDFRRLFDLFFYYCGYHLAL